MLMSIITESDGPPSPTPCGYSSKTTAATLSYGSSSDLNDSAT